PIADRLIATGHGPAHIRDVLDEQGHTVPYDTIKTYTRRRRQKLGGVSRTPSSPSTAPVGVPRVTIGDIEGEAVSRVYDEVEADSLRDEDLLRGWNLDPNVWEIIDGSLM